SPEELAELDFFKGSKRAFKIKTATNFAPVAGRPEPGIKAAVRREYRKGEVICRAGEYGSTAFLIIEGTAGAAIPHRSPAKAGARGVGGAWSSACPGGGGAERSPPRPTRARSAR